MSDIENKTYISDTLTDDKATDIEKNESKEEVIEDSVSIDSETDSDVDTQDEVSTDEVPIFEREDWQDKVKDFEERYPIAKGLSASIASKILDDQSLWTSEHCLDEALIRVLSDNYMADEVRASDEDFLENYIYNNEMVRDRIIEEYIDSLDSRLPRAMNRGGKISLSEPRRPRNISEAGDMARIMMNR